MRQDEGHQMELEQRERVEDSALDESDDINRHLWEEMVNLGHPWWFFMNQDVKYIEDMTDAD